MVQTENLILSRVRVKSIHQWLFEKQTSCYCILYFRKFWSPLGKVLWVWLRTTVHEKFSLQAPEWPFFTIILTILLLFLQIIVLRAHIKGCQFISDSMKFYLPSLRSICVWFAAVTCIIHLLLSFWPTNRWNTAFYGLFWPLFSTSLHLLLCLKVNNIYLRSTGLRCRFQLNADYFTGWASEYWAQYHMGLIKWQLNVSILFDGVMSQWIPDSKSIKLREEKERKRRKKED